MGNARQEAGGKASAVIDKKGTEAGKRTGEGTGKEPGTDTGTPGKPEAGKGTGTGTGTTEKKFPGLVTGIKQGVPGLALIEDVKPEEKPKKKPRKKRQSRQDKAAEECLPAVTGLLGAVFTVAGNKNPIWQVTDSELEMLSEPTAKILGRLELAGGTNEYADYIALFIALAAVCGPRIALTLEAKKKERGAEGGKSNASKPVTDGSGKNPAQAKPAVWTGGHVKAVLPGLAG